MWTTFLLSGLGALPVGGSIPLALEGAKAVRSFAPVDRVRFVHFARWHARMFKHDVLATAIFGGGASHAASSVGAGAGDATALIDSKPATFWSAAARPTGTKHEWVEYRLPEPIAFDTIWLAEPAGDEAASLIERFHIAAEIDGELRTVASGQTIGARRVLNTGGVIGLVRTNRVRVVVESATGPPRLARFSLYATPPSVRIEPTEAMSLHPVTVTMASRAGATIRYSLDGSNVTASSPLYEAPIPVERTAVVRARAFDEGGPGLALATARIHIVASDEWKESVRFERPPENGLRVEAFEGTYESLDAVDTSEAIARKDVLTFDVSTHATRAEQSALRYGGFIEVPQDGLFTFILLSDDGSQLRVHGDLVVDNDGVHEMRRSSGRVALRKGWHPIEVSWFNSRGPGALEVRWGGPGVGRGELIPQTALFR